MIFKLLLLVGIGVNLYGMTEQLYAPLIAVLFLVYLEQIMQDLIKFMARTTYGLLKAYHMLDEEEDS
jgi:hypothetical protein